VQPRSVECQLHYISQAKNVMQLALDRPCVQLLFADRRETVKSFSQIQTRFYTAVNYGDRSLPFTGQSCGTVFQQISVCWIFPCIPCQCSGNDWKCSCSRITVIVQRLTWRICCVAKFAPYKCHLIIIIITGLVYHVMCPFITKL